MTILPHSFFILTLVGLWRPLNWEGTKSLLYNSYSCFIILTNFLFTLTEFLDLLLVSSTVNEFTSNLSMMLAMVAACGKIVGLLCNRKQIIKVLENLQDKSFKPRDQNEEIILQKFTDASSFITRCYWLFLTVGVTGISLTGIMDAKIPEVLPYRSWLPYNYTQPTVYFLTATQQMVTFFIGCYVDVGFDTLFPGMMLYVSAQINILEYRFKNAVKILQELENKNSGAEFMRKSEKILLGDWVECHNSVLSFSDYVYGIFSKPVFIQYCLSSVILCATVYSLSTIPAFTFEFISCIVYIITTVLQIFLVCMSAHQVTLQFSDLNDAIYETDWFKLSNSAQKSIVVITLKTFRPVIFMSGGIITLSLESFKSVIKLSYSIYNVLEQS